MGHYWQLTNKNVDQTGKEGICGFLCVIVSRCFQIMSATNSENYLGKVLLTKADSTVVCSSAEILTPKKMQKQLK